jgi:hypothetical protein
MGPVHRVVVAGNYLLVASGYSLVTLDPVRPAPSDVRARFDLDFEPMDLAIEGSVLGVAGGRAGLRLFDASDPLNLTELGRLGTTGSADALDMIPDLALVAEHGDGTTPTGLSIVDVADAAQPELLATYPVGLWGADDVVSHGTLAFLTGYGLHVLDLSSPAQPVQIGSLVSGGWELAISPSGRRLYSLDQLNPPIGMYALRVIDVSAPQSPAVIGDIQWSSQEPEGLAVDGSHLYSSTPNDGLLVYEVGAEVGLPLLVGTLPSLTDVAQLAAAGSSVYSSERDRGLAVIDVSDPTKPLEVRRIPFPGRSLGLGGGGETLYIRSSTALRALSIVDASNPVDVASFSCDNSSDTAYGWNPTEFVLQSGLAFVPDSTGLRVLDVSDLARIVEVGTWNAPAPARSVAVEGAVLYLGIQSSILNPRPALRVLDISDVTQPIEVGSFEGDGWRPSRLVLGGNLLLGTDPWGTSSCRIFSVDDPWTPTRVGTCDAHPPDIDLLLDGTTLYVASATKLGILDVSDPAVPLVIGELAFEWPPLTGVSRSGSSVFLSHGERGVEIVSIEDPTAPVLMATLDTPGIASRVMAFDKKLFVADGKAGLSIYLDCAVFEDGFESGDTSRWSSASPVGAAADSCEGIAPPANS